MKSLENENEMLKELIQEAFTVIEFYGNRETWSFSYSTSKEVVFREIVFDQYGFFDFRFNKAAIYGGFKARQFLKKYGLLRETQGFYESTRTEGLSEKGNKLN